MIQIVKPIYRFNEAKELNKLIKSLIEDLERENEGIFDSIMDMTFDSTERKDKAFWDVVGNPENYQELIKLQTIRNTNDYIISDLKNIIYKDYEKIPVNQTSPEMKQSKKLNHGECLLWLGTKVKPLILEGITSQKEIGEKICTPANTISQRVKKAYSKPWEEYVEFVQQGIY